MKDLLALLAHLLTTIAKLLRPGGAWAVVADSLLMKQQLLVINRQAEIPWTKSALILNLDVQNSATIHAYRTATDFFRHQLPRE